jgi:hypothetical protein
MAAEELVIQRLGEKFWSGRLWGWEGESCRGNGKFFLESMLLKRAKADCARQSQRCVD